ncbi:MAG: TPM domain-containing protein [Cytophagaceae bacterium]
MAKDFFTEEQKTAIVNAIKSAEKSTSGEIQVHIENHCKADVLDRAAEVFAALNMQNTKLRNGVLFYLALEDHRFAILGDAGINVKVPTGFWESIKDEMILYFKKGNFTEGLCVGIEMAGMKLEEHFPYQQDDVNELPDDISFGNN